MSTVAEAPVETTPATDAPETTPATAERPEAGADIASLRAELETAKQTAHEAREQAQSQTRYVVRLVDEIQNLANQSRNPQAEDEQYREALDKNPRAAIDYAVESRMAPLMEERYAAEADRERDAGMRAAQEKYGDDWKPYVQKVDAFLADVPTKARAKPGAYLAAIKLHMIEDLDTIAEKRSTRRQDTERQAALEGSSGRRGSPSAATITKQEQRMAREFGMTDAEWLKEKAELQRPQDEE
jgi:hypothetical protein